MSTSVERNLITDQSRANELRPKALHGFYVPRLLWSSLVQSCNVRQALRDTFGTGLLGEKSKVIENRN